LNKRTATTIPVLAVFLAFILSACVALPPAMPAPATTGTAPLATEVPQAEPADPLSRCPAATDALQRLVTPEGLYCLAYPAEYKVEKPNAGETILVIGGLLDASNPRAHIRVMDAAGATADAVAEGIVKEFKDSSLERTTQTVAGEPAVVLDKVPGQDINRRVLFTHGGLLYDLMFAPADPAEGEVFSRMAALQDQVLGSFTFLPSGVGIDNDCLAPTGGMQLHKDAAAGYCLLYPAGYSVQQTDANETVLYAGSLQDVSKPKLFVRVEDANGQTAKEIADATAAEVQSALPGHQLDRPFGVTIGYEVAERLDNVPGQDLGRVLIAVHGPRAYRLTFVPADPSDAAMFQQTEALYDLVLRSFRFMN
jgi:hypothetical protein